MNYEVTNEVTHEVIPYEVTIYDLQREQIISLNDIKNNKSFIFKDVLENSPDKEMVVCIVNVFEFIKGDTIKFEIPTQKTILIKPIPLISNAVISKEDDSSEAEAVSFTTIITFTYIYDQKYRYQTIPMTKLGFDYLITLTSNTYQGLYHFENEYGKFRVDLKIDFN